MKKTWLFLLFLPMTILANQLSIALKDAPTNPILTYLASETENNIALEQNLGGKTTLRLENMTLDDVLKNIAKVNNFKFNKENNVYYISEAKENNNLEKNSETINSQQQNPLEKLKTKTIKLHYAKASEVIESLTKGNGSVLSENGYIHFDERSNSILIKDSPHSIKAITSMIKELDQPTEQIAIEARIVTINSESLQELGVRWGMLSSENTKAALDNTTKNLNVNFPVSGGASAVLQIASINSKVLDLELSALEQESSVEIIASPRLLTTNKKPASIKQGTEIPYAMYDRKSETYDLEFKEAVLGLQVTPHISQNNHILMDLIVTQNSQGQSVVSSTSGVPNVPIDKQELNTQVFAKHGETIVLGGVFQHLKSKDSDSVPVLGSIPFLKHLFSYQKDQIAKRELVIFVTPYIIKSGNVSLDSNKSKQNNKKL